MGTLQEVPMADDTVLRSRPKLPLWSGTVGPD